MMTNDEFHERVWSSVGAVVACFALAGLTTCVIRDREFEDECNKAGGYVQVITAARACLTEIKPIPVPVP